MKDINEVTFCVVDSGLFLPMAYRLAEQAKRVIYWSPECRAFPSMKQACIGDGFDNIERVRDFWPLLSEIDCFCFPDVGQGELQVHLAEECNKPVWGSRRADWLELDRERFMAKLGELRLDVAPFEAIEGWTRLCDYLKDRQDLYIKISRFRADFETKHWRSWDQDSSWLYSLAIKFGPLREEVRFLVFEDIETELEIGADTYSVDGQWPETMLHGIEGKDKCYLAAVTPRADMPPQLLEIMKAFSPLLREEQCRNQWSMEVRINDEGSFFIDATMRGGMPSSGSQQLLWDNFPEIVYAGAQGELVNPEPVANFSIECMITGSVKDADLWENVPIDPLLLPHARFSNCCFVDGKFAFPPDDHGNKDLGWLVAYANTPKEALRRIKTFADLLPSGLNADVEALSEVIERIETEEKDGISFTDQSLPKPAEVL